MKQSALVVALLALALTACGDKPAEEAAVVAPASAVVEAPAAAPVVAADASAVAAPVADASGVAAASAVAAPAAH